MISVVYACNDAYVRQTVVSMVSVIKYNPNAKIYLIADQISTENREMIAEALGRFDQSTEIIELDAVLPDIEFDEADRHPKTVYAKLFLDKVIQEDRVLYLDSDVVVTDTLESLFARTMDGKAAGGILMPYSGKLKERTGCEAGKPYICDGVVLLNLEWWRKSGKEAECAAYIREHNGKPPMLSEGTLNHICQNEMEILEPKYNVMPSMLMYNLEQIRTLFRADYYYEWQEEMDEARERPVMVHFMNELYNRPWFEPCDHPMKQEYRKIHQLLFQSEAYPRRYLTKKTCLTRTLHRILPFPVFFRLYGLKHREIV